MQDIESSLHKLSVIICYFEYFDIIMTPRKTKREGLFNISADSTGICENKPDIGSMDK